MFILFIFCLYGKKLEKTIVFGEKLMEEYFSNKIDFKDNRKACEEILDSVKNYPDNFDIEVDKILLDCFVILFKNREFISQAVEFDRQFDILKHKQPFDFHSFYTFQLVFDKWYQNVNQIMNQKIAKAAKKNKMQKNKNNYKYLKMNCKKFDGIGQELSEQLFQVKDQTKLLTGQIYDVMLFYHMLPKFMKLHFKSELNQNRDNIYQNLYQINQQWKDKIIQDYSSSIQVIEFYLKQIKKIGKICNSDSIDNEFLLDFYIVFYQRFSVQIKPIFDQLNNISIYFDQTYFKIVNEFDKIYKIEHNDIKKIKLMVYQLNYIIFLL